jgi:hypothetical protein
MVLVAIEALSNYVLVEQYAEQRDAATWNAVVHEQLRGLNIEVEGLTADGAKGIAVHARQAFGLEVTPDLFHSEHDVSRGMMAALASRVRAQEERLHQVQQQGGDDKAVATQLATARGHQQRAAAAIEGMSEACRPYDERTGEIRRDKQVCAELNEMHDEANAVATEAGLSDTSHKGIDEARHGVDAMAASIEAYHLRTTLSLDALHLPPAIHAAMFQHGAASPVSAAGRPAEPRR